MKRHIVTFTAAAFLALGVSSAWAQRPNQDSGPSRPADPTGGRGVGGGETRSGGDSTPATSGSSSGTVTGSGSSSSVSTPSTSSGSTGGGGNSIGWGGRPGIDFPRAEAPRRGPGFAAYSEAGQGRAVPRGSGGGDQGRAAPRGEGGGDQGRAAPRGESGGGEVRSAPRGEGRAAPRDPGGGGERRAVPRGEGGASGPGAAAITQDGGGRQAAQPRSAVPAYSRPREGRTPIGSAVERGDGIGRGGVIVTNPWLYYGNYWGYPYGNFGYYNRYGWYPGYGFGLGYFYDPFWYGGSYGYGGYYGGGGAGYYRSRGYDTGSLRLKVQPRDAKVYVDGYFVGVVDSFDGVFQKLAVEAGTHRIEIRADGYEPAQFEVMVTPGETITYKGQLKRLEP